MAHEALRLSVANPGLLGLIGAPTYPLLRDASQLAVFELLDQNGIPYKFLKQENLLELTDFGSRIVFRSLDNPKSLVGTNLAWFGVDELTFCKEESWKRLQARLRHPKSKELCGFGVWTPNGFDWVWQRFISKTDDQGKPLAGADDYFAVVGNPGENKALPGDYYEKLAGSYDERFYRQEVLGEYLNIRSGRVYYAFDRATNVRACPLRENAELWLTCDFNNNPMSWLICQVADMSTRMDLLHGKPTTLEIEALDEVSIDGSIDDACRLAKDKILTLRPPQYGQVTVNVTGDAAGNNRDHAGKSDWYRVLDFFRNDSQVKLVKQVPSADPPVKDRVNAVNALLRNYNSVTRLWADPRCHQLVRDLEQVIWKADSNGNIVGLLDKSNPKLTHMSDALGYLVHRLQPLKSKVGYGSERII